MRKYLSVVCGAVLLTICASAAQAGKAAPDTRALKVKVRYTGSGTVDEKHKIFVFLFNSADFMHGDAMPVGTASISAKEDSVTFSDVADSPVYVTSIYDPSGNYDGQSAPPSGSSAAMYSKSPGVPEPIKIDPGKTVEVTITFDDSNKMK